MNENHIELIDKFLHNELSPEEEKKFDELSKNNIAFQNEIKIQQAISTAAYNVQNAEIMAEIEKQHNQFIERQQTSKKWKWGISFIIVVLLSIIGYFIWTNNKKTEPNQEYKNKIQPQKDTIQNIEIIEPKDVSKNPNDQIEKIEDTQDSVIRNDSKEISTNTIPKNDTLFLKESTLPSYVHMELIKKEYDKNQYYEFDGKVLRIYGLPQLDYDLCKLNIARNKFYLFQPGDKMFLCEIKKTSKKTRIKLLKGESIAPLFLSSVQPLPTKSIKIEQKLTNAKEVTTNFSIFVIDPNNNSEGIMIIPEKKQLFCSQKTAKHLGQDFEITFFSENNQYYIRRDKKYFKVNNVKKLQNLVLEQDPVILRYLTTHTEDIQIQKYGLESESTQYTH